MAFGPARILQLPSPSSTWIIIRCRVGDIHDSPVTATWPSCQIQCSDFEKSPCWLDITKSSVLLLRTNVINFVMAATYSLTRWFRLVTNTVIERLLISHNRKIDSHSLNPPSVLNCRDECGQESRKLRHGDAYILSVVSYFPLRYRPFFFFRSNLNFFLI